MNSAGNRERRCTCERSCQGVGGGVVAAVNGGRRNAQRRVADLTMSAYIPIRKHRDVCATRRDLQDVLATFVGGIRRQWAHTRQLTGGEKASRRMHDPLDICATRVQASPPCIVAPPPPPLHRMNFPPWPRIDLPVIAA